MTRRFKTNWRRRRPRLIALMLLAVSVTYFAIRVIPRASLADDVTWRWPDVDLGKRSFAIDSPPVEFPIQTPTLGLGESRRIATGTIAFSENIIENTPEDSFHREGDTRSEAILSGSHRGQIATVDIQSLLTAYAPTDAPESTRNAIREQIMQSVRHCSGRRGYPLVLDRSGKSLNGVNVVHFAGGVADLTEEVREELRRAGGVR